MKRSYTKEQKEWVVKKLPYYSPIVLANMFKEHYNKDIKVGTIRNIKHTTGIKSNYKRKIYNTKFRDKIKKPLYNEIIGNRGKTYVRVANRKYQIKTRYIWEQYYGRKIPKGYEVIFLDGNKENYGINNLVLVKHNVRIYALKKEIDLKSKDIINTTKLCFDLDKKVKEVINNDS